MNCSTTTNIYGISWTCMFVGACMFVRFAKECLWRSFNYIKGLFSTQTPCDRLSQWWGRSSPGLLTSRNWHRNRQLGFNTYTLTPAQNPLTPFSQLRPGYVQRKEFSFICVMSGGGVGGGAVHCLYVLLNMLHNQITIMLACAHTNTNARESLFSQSRCLWPNEKHQYICWSSHKRNGINYSLKFNRHHHATVTICSAEMELNSFYFKKITW